MQEEEKPSKVWKVKPSDYMPKPKPPTEQEILADRQLEFFDLDKKQARIKETEQKIRDKQKRLESLHQCMHDVLAPQLKVVIDTEKIQQKQLKNVKELEKQIQQKRKELRRQK